MPFPGYGMDRAGLLNVLLLTFEKVFRVRLEVWRISARTSVPRTRTEVGIDLGFIRQGI